MAPMRAQKRMGAFHEPRGRARHSVRADVEIIRPGAHGVTRPTCLCQFMVAMRDSGIVGAVPEPHGRTAAIMDVAAVGAQAAAGPSMRPALRFAFGSWSQCAWKNEWRLSMNRTRNPLEMRRTTNGGSWPRFTSEFWRCPLPMNPPALRATTSHESNGLWY